MAIPEGYEVVSDIPEGYEAIDQAPDAQAVTSAPEKKNRSVKDIYNGFKFGTMVENIPSSAYDVASDIANTIAHPIDAITGLGNVGAGLISKALDLDTDTESMADAVGEFIKDRYGSEEALKQTIMTDPVGALSDFAAVLTGGGAMVPKVGSKISKVGAAIDPLNLATAGGTKLAANLPGVRELPAKLYESSAKFSTTIPPRERRALTNTALKNQILPSSGGVEKANDIIGGYNDKIEALIEQSTQSGQTVNKSALYGGLKELRQELGGVNLDAPKDLKKINDVIKVYEYHLKKIGKENLTASDLQTVKQGIYKSINYKKKKMQGSRAKEQTYKSIARSAKEQLEVMHPEIKGLNAKEGEMLALMDEIKRSAARIENRDVLGIGVPLKTTAGAVSGGPGGAAAGLAISLLDTPAIKSRIALALQRAKEIKIADPGRALSLEAARLIGKDEKDER